LSEICVVLLKDDRIVSAREWGVSRPCPLALLNLKVNILTCCFISVAVE